MKQIPIACTELTEEEIESAVGVMRSGQLRQGKETEAFEKEFAEKVGARHAIASSSGTSALHLAYMCVLKPGDEVLVPSFTFIATASMVSMCGAKPVFCDVDRESFLIDLADAEGRLSGRTRAVAPVHLFGNPCNVDAVTSFARTHNLTIVWDCAQAHGALYRGCDVGSFSQFTCYSFYPTKNIFVGEGGMTCTDNDDYAEKIRFLRSHGQTGKYYHTMLGLNYRMTDVEAAIGRKQLRRLDEMLNLRRRNARILNEGLEGIPGLKPQKSTPDSEHAYHQYCIVVDPDEFGCDRDCLAERLKKKGIATGVHYPRGLHHQPVFEELYGKTHLPNTEFLAERVLALPVHHGLSEEDVRYVVNAVRQCRG